MAEMPNVVHFSEKELSRLESDFKRTLQTEHMFSHEMDEQFSGVKTVHVKILKSEPLQDYDKTKPLSQGSRYGETTEMGDFEQTYTMEKDRSLSLSVDLANNQDQMNMKTVSKITSAERDEQINPELDTYRIKKWCQDAGIHFQLSANPTKANIVNTILDLRGTMLDKHVPKNGLTLVIPRKWSSTLMLSTEWAALDSLLGKTLPDGYIGRFAGMTVYEADSDIFDNNAAFMIVHKGSIIAPMKLNKFTVHKNPPGLSGLLIEFRMRYDAFVLGHKPNGVAVACLPNTVQAAPTITLNGSTATIAASGATEIIYTVDGSDPRFSVDAKTYTAGFTVPNGATVKAYAVKSGLYKSDVTEKTYTA